MSDDVFPNFPGMVPVMTPDKARDIGRAYKWLADNVTGDRLNAQARREHQESQWWLAYSIALAMGGPG